MIKTLVVVVFLAFMVGSFVVYTRNTEVISQEETSSVTKNEETTQSSDAISKEGDENEGETVEINSSEVLDLSGQGLKKAPDYIFGEIKIQKLDLSDNELEGSLQAEIRLLQNLKVLDLSNNKFTGVPAEIGQLKNLEVLDLSNNQLTGLPHELANLSNLRLLNLQGNAYSTTDLDIIKQQLSDSVEIRVD